METKRLWGYLDAVRELNRARENLAEFESVIYSPSSPGGGSGYNSTPESMDKLAPVTEKHQKLIAARDDATLAVFSAYMMLEQFGELLSGDDYNVLILKYRKGYSMRAMIEALHRSERTIIRAQNRIKEKFSKFQS